MSVRKENIKKIRIDCKQSARISGTTPSGCTFAHPLEAKSPDRRKAIRKEVGKEIESISSTRPESRGLHPADAQMHLLEAKSPDLTKARKTCKEETKALKIRADCMQSA